jgi:phage terminase large subunit GpA-like protein
MVAEALDLGERLAIDVWGYWRPPPLLNLDEWADEHGVLSAESSAEGGRWTTLAYQRGIMRAITDPSVEFVTCMKSARVGWTKIINHAVGYHMHQDPCPIAVVQPTLEDAEGYSKDEIAPMLRDTPALAGLVADPRSRDSGNTLLLKSFPGGVLQLIGANSPRGFRRVTRRVMIFDELDGYPQSAGAEGDQYKLGVMRTLTFHNRKILAGSTPTLEITSRIARLFEKSDQRYYYVPCPECDHKQVLKFARLRWEKGQPDTVRYICENCEFPIPHHMKRWMIEEADKRQRNGEPGIGWVATKPFEGHAGFHIWAGYSYAPNATWAHLAAEFEACKDNVEELKTFVNTVLGETWKGKGDAPDWQRLYDRREQYQVNTLPDVPVLLFAGADVQKDRIEVEIVAYSRRCESWSIDYRVFPGDTANITAPDSPWRGLEALMAEHWHHSNGVPLGLRMLAVDAGYNTNAVLSWVRKWPSSRVIAVIGREDQAIPVAQPKAVDVMADGKKKQRGAKQWPVGVGILKSELYGWLKQERPTAESGEEHPHGYCHFPEYGEEFFKQLTAEEMVAKVVRGYKRYLWQKTRERNEALDCRVYARAAAILCGIDRIPTERWQEMAYDAGLLKAHAKIEQEQEPATTPDTDAAPKTTVINGVRIERRTSEYWNRRR